MAWLSNRGLDGYVRDCWSYCLHCDLWWFCLLVGTARIQWHHSKHVCCAFVHLFLLILYVTMRAIKVAKIQPGSFMENRFKFPAPLGLVGPKLVPVPPA